MTRWSTFRPSPAQLGRQTSHDQPCRKSMMLMLVHEMKPKTWPHFFSFLQAIFDFDVHHGQGTEAIVKTFGQPDKLMFSSIHLYETANKGAPM